MIFKKLIFLILIIGLLSCNINSTKRAKIEDVVAEQKQSEYCEFQFPKMEEYMNDYEHIFISKANPCLLLDCNVYKYYFIIVF